MKRKYPNLTIGSKLFMVAVFACLIAGILVFKAAIYG